MALYVIGQELYVFNSEVNCFYYYILGTIPLLIQFVDAQYYLHCMLFAYIYQPHMELVFRTPGHSLSF